VFSLCGLVFISCVSVCMVLLMEILHNRIGVDLLTIGLFGAVVYTNIFRLVLRMMVRCVCEVFF
jgi:hypothetical protein